MKKMKPKNNIIYVEWIDSIFSSGWRYGEELLDYGSLGKCCTAGFLFLETEESITITLNADPAHIGNCVGQTITIPKVAITKRKKL